MPILANVDAASGPELKPQYSVRGKARKSLSLPSETKRDLRTGSIIGDFVVKMKKEPRDYEPDPISVSY